MTMPPAIQAGTRWRLVGRRYIAIQSVDAGDAECIFTDAQGVHVPDEDDREATLSARYIAAHGALIVARLYRSTFRCSYCGERTERTGSRMHPDGTRCCPGCYGPAAARRAG